MNTLTIIGIIFISLVIGFLAGITIMYKVMKSQKNRVWKIARGIDPDEKKAN